MLRGHIVDPPTNTEEVVSWVRELVGFLDMKIVQGPFATYIDIEGNRGLTSVVMIETSHIAFHIWDEQDPALIQLDIYTCGSLDINQTLDFLETYFNFTSLEYIVYDREHGLNLITTDVNSD